MQKRLFAVLLLLVFLGIGLSIAGGSDDFMPHTVYAWGEDLHFISLDRAIDGAGRIDSELLRPSDVHRLRISLDAPEGPRGCVEENYDSPLDYPSREKADTERAVLSSDNVLIGQVVGHKVGYFGRLGFLVAIETEEIIRGDPLASFYIFYPKGDFRYSGRKYCLQHDAYPPLPTKGDRIIVMHRHQIQGPLIQLVPTQLIVLPKTGEPQFGKSQVSYPDISIKARPQLTTAAETVEWIKDLARSVGTP